jgi:hypothetical protein
MRGATFRAAAVAFLSSAAVACDCGGRSVDVHHYRCTDSSSCGEGWSCVDGGCVEGAAGGGATGGGSAGGGAALGGGSQSGGGTATGGGGAVDAGTLCDVYTMAPCGQGYTCQWRNITHDPHAGLCAPGCDPVAQNCPHKCGLDTSSYLACEPNGFAVEGEPCSTDDACNAGLACSSDVGPTSFCRQYCNWTDAGCPAGQFCINTVAVQPPGAFARVCEPNPCSLLAQDCGGFACRPFVGGGNNCFQFGTQDAGTPCVVDSDCRAGLICAVAPGQGSECRGFCSLDGGPPACPAPQQCSEYFDSTGFLIEGGTAGVCL